MRAIRRHITAIAALTALSLSVGIIVPVAAAWAAAASNPVTNNPAIQKQLQEALAKAQAQKAAGGSATGGAGSEAGNGSPFSKLTEKSGEEEATATTRTAPKKTESSGTTGSIPSGVLLPLLIIGGGVLAGIAFLILRDARGVTPAGDLFAPPGSAEARAARLRKRRAKAKAARQQRKRNR